MLTLNCPECRQSIQADVSYRGKQMVCPACGKTVAIPTNPYPTVAEHGRAIAVVLWIAAATISWLIAGCSGCNAANKASGAGRNDLSAIQITQIMSMEIAEVVGLFVVAVMLTIIPFLFYAGARMLSTDP